MYAGILRDLRPLLELGLAERSELGRCAGDYAEAGLDRLVPVMKSPDNAYVFVIGGAGKHSAYIPTFGATHPVTLPLTTHDGKLAKSVEEFRRK